MLAESGRAVMEQLLRSWLLELRAEHKSEKTRVAYGDAANQFMAFLADPPAGLDGELAAAIAEAPAIAEMPDLKAVHIRLFMSYLYAAGQPDHGHQRSHRDRPRITRHWHAVTPTAGGIACPA